MTNFQERFEDYGIRGVNMSASGEQRAICPNCPPHKSDHDRSTDLAVNAIKGTWYCHRCDFKGSLKKEFIKPAFNKIESKAVPVAENHFNYFEKKRGIPRNVILRNKITKDKIYIPGPNEEKAVICFNYYIGDNLVNIKYRTIDKQFCQVKGGAKVFYKLNDIEGLTSCIITEGEFDALSFEVAGFRNAISVPDGAINPNAQNITTKLSFLDNCADYFTNMDKIYLATDNDAPGIRLREELARRLGKSKCYICVYPDGCKDANDVLMKHGSGALVTCIEGAEPYPVEGIHNASERKAELDDLYEHGYPNGARTGSWSKFDNKLQFFGSMLAIVTGIPSHGKSNWLDALAIHLNLNAGIKFGLFSPENKKIEIHLHRLSEIAIGKPLLPSYNNQMSKENKEQAFEYINKNFFFILPDNDDFKIDKILEAAAYLVLKQGIKALIIDPWNMIEHSPNGEKETDYTGKVLNKIQYFAANHDLLIFLVAHPTKMYKKPGQDKFDVPTLYNISGSANWYNKADYGFCVYREFWSDANKDAYTTVHIQKVKHKFMGSLGFVKFDFDTSCQRYYERDEPRNDKNYLENHVDLTSEGYPGLWDEDKEPF